MGSVVAVVRLWRSVVVVAVLTHLWRFVLMVVVGRLMEVGPEARQLQQGCSGRRKYHPRAVLRRRCPSTSAFCP